MLAKGGNHSMARVSMHIHASPPHRLTATTLQREMVSREWGMDKKGGGGQKGRSVSEYFQHLLEVSVWTSAHRDRIEGA